MILPFAFARLREERGRSIFGSWSRYWCPPTELHHRVVLKTDQTYNTYINLDTYAQLLQTLEPFDTAGEVVSSIEQLAVKVDDQS